MAAFTRQSASDFVAAIANDVSSIYSEGHIARSFDGSLVIVRALLKEDFSRGDGGGQWIEIVDDGV